MCISLPRASLNRCDDLEPQHLRCPRLPFPPKIVENIPVEDPLMETHWLSMERECLTATNSHQKDFPKSLWAVRLKWHLSQNNKQTTLKHPCEDEHGAPTSAKLYTVIWFTRHKLVGQFKNIFQRFPIILDWSAQKCSKYICRLRLYRKIVLVNREHDNMMCSRFQSMNLPRPSDPKYFGSCIPINNECESKSWESIAKHVCTYSVLQENLANLKGLFDSFSIYASLFFQEHVSIWVYL